MVVTEKNWGDMIREILLIPLIDKLIGNEIRSILDSCFFVQSKYGFKAILCLKIITYNTIMMPNALLAKTLNNIPFPFPFSILETIQ